MYFQTVYMSIYTGIPSPQPSTSPTTGSEAADSLSKLLLSVFAWTFCLSCSMHVPCISTPVCLYMQAFHHLNLAQVVLLTLKLQIL